MRPLRLALTALRAARNLCDQAKHLRRLSDRTRSLLEVVIADLRQAEQHLQRALQVERDQPRPTPQHQPESP